MLNCENKLTGNWMPNLHLAKESAPIKCTFYMRIVVVESITLELCPFVIEKLDTADRACLFYSFQGNKTEVCKYVTDVLKICTKESASEILFFNRITAVQT